MSLLTRTNVGKFVDKIVSSYKLWGEGWTVGRIISYIIIGMMRSVVYIVYKILFLIVTLWDPCKVFVLVTPMFYGWDIIRSTSGVNNSAEIISHWMSCDIMPLVRILSNFLFLTKTKSLDFAKFSKFH